MRTRANILTSGSGGFWSDALSIEVPTQPQEMTDENFNVTSYTYRYSISIPRLGNFQRLKPLCHDTI